MAKRKYYGIRFPFTAIEEEGFYVDLESTYYRQIKSNLIHLIFTPKGSKLRDPEFGTNLLNYLFQPNDEITGSDIQREIQSSISKYFPSIKLTNLEYTQVENKINVKIAYSIDEGSYLTTDNIDITL